MPAPKKGESKKQYISRCMGHSEMKSKFSNPKQRVAVCYSYWDESLKESKLSFKQYLIQEATTEITPSMKKEMLYFAAEEKEFHNLSKQAQYALYDMYFKDMPHGVRTGDTGTPDEWLSNHFYEVYKNTYDKELKETNDKELAHKAGLVAIKNDLGF